MSRAVGGGPAGGLAAPALAALVALALASPVRVRAQAVPAPGDTVQVETRGGAYQGPVLEVDSAHLVLRAALDWIGELPRTIELALRPEDIYTLRVQAQPRSRGRGALKGALAGAMAPALYLAWRCSAGGCDEPIGAEQWKSVRFVAATPFVTAVLGYLVPGHRWKNGRLPGAGGQR